MSRSARALWPEVTCRWMKLRSIIWNRETAKPNKAISGPAAVRAEAAEDRFEHARVRGDADANRLRLHVARGELTLQALEAGFRARRDAKTRRIHARQIEVIAEQLIPEVNV